MGMKTSKILLVVLVALMMVSLSLTALLIIRPAKQTANTGLGQTTTTVGTTTDNQTRTSLIPDEVFSPSRYVYNHDDKIEVTSDKAVLKALNLELHQSFENIQSMGTLEQYNYEQLLLKQSAGQLLFDAPIPIKNAVSYFVDIPDEFANTTITRIVLLMDDVSTAYLINDQTKASYSVTRKKQSNEFLKSAYSEKLFYPIQSYITKGGLTFVRIDDIKLDQLTYLVEQPMTSFYIGMLYSNTTDLKNRSDNKSIVYNDNVSQLIIDRSSSILSYFRNRLSESVPDMSTTLQHSFNQMNRFENWTYGIYYSGYSQTSQAVDFLRYVNNFPILDANQQGTLRITVTDDGLSKMRIPTLVAQTPLVSRTKQVSLMSGDDAVSVIMSKGIDLLQVEDVRIGYQWVSSQESNKIVNFIPTWFVKINGAWQTVDSATMDQVTLEDAGELEPVSMDLGEED